MKIIPQGHPEPAPNTAGWNRVLLRAAEWLVQDLLNRGFDADGARTELLKWMDNERKHRQWPAPLYNNAGMYYAEAIHIVYRKRVTPFPKVID